MMIDLFHNKIVKDTATDAFVDSFNRVLVPMLEDKYGDALERVTMYEDYLADGFTYEGEWYYPLSVKLADAPTFTSWVKWPVNKKNFHNSIPYAYVGEGDIEFSFAGFLPAGFAEKLQGRAIDYDRSAIKLTVEAATDDVTLLVGKYSQTFVDELARQITTELCRAASVKDLGTSTMELQLVFAPGTYLEHTSESVTYRRLLLVDKGCQARDFWVKWTRLDGKGGYRVSDNVTPATVKFEVGEDVKQKIREKEYRFLAGANPDKYQSAMGKKTVTEWRDIIKRAVKRGELTKVEPVVVGPSIPVMEPKLAPTLEAVDNRIQDDMSEQLRALLDSFGVSTAAPEETDEEDSYDDVAALARSVLGQSAPTEDDTVETEETVEETDDAPFDMDELTEETTDEDEFEVEIEIEDGEDDEAPFDVDDTVSEEETVEQIADEPVVDEETATEEPKPEKIVHFNFDAIEEEIIEPAEEPEEEFFTMGEEDAEEETFMAEPKPIDEAAIRREIEEKLRREYEAEARARAEREAEALRLEHARLREENERLARLAKEAEEKRLREEEARRLAEEERLRQLEEKKLEEERQRAELEAKMRLEAEERARIAEAARMAVEEQKRLEAERAAKAERLRQEELAREVEATRLAEESRRLEEARRLEDERRREEEERRRRQEEAAKARPTVITKQAKIMFRYSVDVNVLKRIKQVIEKTLVDNGKETLNIHIKAYPVDSSSISLEIKLPDTEMELLVSMMKALGGASLGITKIILE